MRQRVFLDFNSTTPVAPEVLEAMSPYLHGRYGNPSSIHAEGREARGAVETARSEVAAWFGVAPEAVVFTGSGSEGNLLAVRGTVRAAAAQGDSRRHLVTSALEHPSVAACFQRLATEGYAVTAVAPTREGIVPVEAVTNALREDTLLVSLMHANNETGAVQPVAAVAAACRSRGIRFHTDVAQSLGKVPETTDLRADLLTGSGHKVYGPKGIGFLVRAGDPPLTPLVEGGGQEAGLRAGTEHVAGIVGLAAACRLWRDRGPAWREQLRRLRDRLEDGLRERIPGAVVNGPDRDHRLPTTANVSFPGVDGVTLSMNLDLAGFAVSTGSACHSGVPGGSATLAAMGLSEDRGRGAIRFSVGHGITEAQIDALLEVIGPLVERSAAKQSTSQAM